MEKFERNANGRKNSTQNQFAKSFRNKPKEFEENGKERIKF